MIARIWHGSVPTAKSDKYHEYLFKTGLKDYTKINGNMGVYLLKRKEGDLSHFFTLTFWSDTEAIKKFAGNDFERAKYYPDDKLYLTEEEPFVSHYEIVEISPLRNMANPSEKFRLELFQYKPILFYK